MKKFIFIAAALILITVASVAAWQIYVPVHEDNVSIQAYDNLRQFVELPAPEPTPRPSTNKPIPPSISPTRSPNPDSMVTSVPQVDFESLRAVNPEIVAWLTIDGTNINYPVAQHSDNDYYLHHLFTGEWNSSGCIFLDSRNAADFSSCHTIIYGHHMDNGTMFQNLMGYKSQAFYDEHPTGQLITPNGSYTVEFFAGYVASVEDDAWSINFASDEDFVQWLSRNAQQGVAGSRPTRPDDGRAERSKL